MHSSSDPASTLRTIEYSEYPQDLAYQTFAEPPAQSCVIAKRIEASVRQFVRSEELCSCRLAVFLCRSVRET